MKILYLDFLYPKGHLKQNEIYISLIAKFAKVFVLCDAEKYHLNSKNVELIINQDLHIRDGRLLTRLDTVRVMAYSQKVAKMINPDIIFISSYETITYAIFSNFFSKKYRTFILQHSNIDELTNRFKRILFSIYCKKTNFVVFEDFIKDYIRDKFKVDQQRIFVLPHQLNHYQYQKSDNIYDCVGLSFSNDEDTISEIIEHETKFETFKNNQKKVILKSRYQKFDNGYLKIINGYIDDETFSDYINNAKSMYIPFPKSFQYRMSGTLIDALSKKSIVYGNRIPVIENYAQKYKHLCRVVDSPLDFVDSIVNEVNNESKSLDSDYLKFCNDHSNQRILTIFRELFSFQFSNE